MCRPGARFTKIFYRNSNSIETSPCCNSARGRQIATSFCTCQDSTAAVPCTKLCSGHCIRIKGRVKLNFHRIWIAMEKPLVTRGPGCAMRLWTNLKGAVQNESKLTAYPTIPGTPVIHLAPVCPTPKYPGIRVIGNIMVLGNYQEASFQSSLLWVGVPLINMA